MKTKKSTSPQKVVFLFDVDNTLLNNDQVTRDLQNHLEREVGPAEAKRYWTIFENQRCELGYADYLGALQRFRTEYPHNLRLLTVSSFLINYPFANRLYPNSLDAIAKAKSWGQTALLTDGDVVFQPRKVERSGLLEAVENHVLVYVHKQNELADVARRYPSQHYVVVDDKLRLLTAIKEIWKKRVTTVFVKQGHYALDPKIIASCPPADVSLERIGDFVDCTLPGLLAAAQNKSA
jgi:FMN phosphatase YigB (HAD superfamily)